MKTSLFDYVLPPELIAHVPHNPRDASRLLTINRKAKTIKHHSEFSSLEHVLQPGDVLVLNDTKVIPARLMGHKHTGGRIEILLVKPTREGSPWEALTKPGLKPGQEVIFTQNLRARSVGNQQNGLTTLQFNTNDKQLMDLLTDIGKTPIPPYITPQQNESELREAYQTVFATHPGSVAAPTAGLHFTQDLLNRLNKKGIQISYLTLHVGPGTFKSVKTDSIANHSLHHESFNIAPHTAKTILDAKNDHRRIIAVGTTTTRVLESLANQKDPFKNLSGETDIFIYPSFKFKIIDGLITNFHLPQSTLLMLVSAFVSSPNTPNEFTNFRNSLAGIAYAQAIERKYRFYSFGDAMLIL